MSFREKERKRQVSNKNTLFSKEACNDGFYKNKSRSFCLDEDYSTENLHASISENAIEYFFCRQIIWHDGLTKIRPQDVPSNHLCCSQSFCVNSLFPFIDKPVLLKSVLQSLGYSVSEILPFILDKPLHNGSHPYLAFEWIGQKNYLGELKLGKVAADDDRDRGQGFTSADFAVRFRREDGHVQIILGEWKYTEYYNNSSIQISASGTDRLARIYGKELTKTRCPIKLPANIRPEVLFFNPFDQMMRLQLMAAAMERGHEMEADFVTAIHIAPKENKELMNRITSNELSCLGNNIHAIWSNLVGRDKFKAIYSEDIIPVILNGCMNESWNNYMRLRYSWPSS